MLVHNTWRLMQSSIAPTRRTVAITAAAVTWVGLLTAAPTARQAAAPQPAPAAVAILQAPDAFEARIRPLLAANCYACHGESAMGGLRLDTREGFFKGSDAGAVVEPGKPESSTLIKVLQHAPGYPAMPKGRAKMPQGDIDLLTEWVRLGASWPAPTTAATATTPVASHAKAITAEQRAFWSFAPLGATAAPRGARHRLAVDRHRPLRPGAAGSRRAPPVRGRRQAHAAAPRDARPDRPAADARRDRRVPRRHVARRVREGDRSAARLAAIRRDVGPGVAGRRPLRRGRLPQPRSDGPRLNPYPNALPLPRLGDPRVQRRPALRPVRHARSWPPTCCRAAERVRHLPALGLLGLGPWYYDNGAVEITRADERHDRVDAVSRGFLGLTVGCARCHDHKYDPIPTTDYYALARRVPQHRVQRVSAGAEGGGRRVQGEGKGAQDRSARCSASSCRWKPSSSPQTLAFETAKYMKAAWQVTGEPKKDEGRDRRAREARLRAVRALARCSWRKPPDVLPVPRRLAGDDRRRRHGEGGREAGHGLPGAGRSRSMLERAGGQRRRTRSSSARGAADGQAEGARRTCPTSSRPTTTSAPAAASS